MWYHRYSISEYSLALFRVALSLYIGWESLQWLLREENVSIIRSHSVWPTELGMNPILHQSLSSPYEYHFSLYFINSSIFYQISLIILQIALSILLLIGYHTRWVAFLLWLLICSFHSRIEIFLDLSDHLLRVLLFFHILSDWNCKFSIDRNLSSMITYHYYSSPSLISDLNLNSPITNNNNIDNDIGDNFSIIDSNQKKYEERRGRRKNGEGYVLVSRMCGVLQCLFAHYLFAYSLSDLSFRDASSFSVLSNLKELFIGEEMRSNYNAVDHAAFTYYWYYLIWIALISLLIPFSSPLFRSISILCFCIYYFSLGYFFPFFLDISLVFGISTMIFIPDEMWRYFFEKTKSSNDRDKLKIYYDGHLSRSRLFSALIPLLFLLHPSTSFLDIHHSSNDNNNNNIDGKKNNNRSGNYNIDKEEGRVASPQKRYIIMHDEEDIDDFLALHSFHSHSLFWVKDGKGRITGGVRKSLSTLIAHSLIFWPIGSISNHFSFLQKIDRFCTIFLHFFSQLFSAFFTNQTQTLHRSPSHSSLISHSQNYGNYHGNYSIDFRSFSAPSSSSSDFSPSFLSSPSQTSPLLPSLFPSKYSPLIPSLLLIFFLILGIFSALSHIENGNQLAHGNHPLVEYLHVINHSLRLDQTWNDLALSGHNGRAWKWDFYFAVPAVFTDGDLRNLWPNFPRSTNQFQSLANSRLQYENEVIYQNSRRWIRYQLNLVNNYRKNLPSYSNEIYYFSQSACHYWNTDYYQSIITSINFENHCVVINNQIINNNVNIKDDAKDECIDLSNLQLNGLKYLEVIANLRDVTVKDTPFVPLVIAYSSCTKTAAPDEWPIFT